MGIRIRNEGKKKLLRQVMDIIRKGVLAGLEELAQLGRTLWCRRKDILVHFDIGASNGSVEAINGCLERLRGIALGFRNLNHYNVYVPHSLRKAQG